MGINYLVGVADSFRRRAGPKGGSSPPGGFSDSSPPAAVGTDRIRFPPGAGNAAGRFDSVTRQHSGGVQHRLGDGAVGLDGLNELPGLDVFVGDMGQCFMRRAKADRRDARLAR